MSVFGLVAFAVFVVIIVGMTALIGAPIYMERQLLALRRRVEAGRPYPGRSLWQTPVLILFALATLGFAVYQAHVAAEARGHLPWPLAGWALTTPLGVVLAALLLLALLAPVVRALLTGPDLLARARDITDLPPDRWPPRPSERAAHRVPRDEHWLGRGRRARMLNLLALAAAILLALAFAAGIIAALFETPPPTWCGPVHCAPLYPTVFIMVACFEVILGIRPLIEYIWARRVERSAGVRLLYTRTGINYIRHAGVSHEDAAAALARATPARHPQAREVATGMLLFSPMLALFCAGVALAKWLPALWRP